MGFLVASDYSKTIQADNLNQVISNTPSILDAGEATAREEAISYLVQKYDVSAIAPLPVWDNATQFYQGQIITDGTDVYVVKQYQPTFDTYATYKVGDQVIWKGKSYRCAIATIYYNRTTALQYGEIQDLPLTNVFPDDATDGVKFWGVGVLAGPTIGTLLTDGVYFTKTDTRSAQLVTCICNIALYYVHMRIAPRNIPDLRVKAYDDAIKWLKGCAEGKFTPALTKLQPRKGGRIRYGGQVKNRNQW